MTSLINKLGPQITAKVCKLIIYFYAVAAISYLVLLFFILPTHIGQIFFFIGSLLFLDNREACGRDVA